MEKIKIFGDSTCDLPREILERFDLEVMPLPVYIGDKQYLDGVDATPEDIYHYYETTGKMSKTSAPNANDYINFWKPWIDQGYEVIHFHISSEISGTYNSARLAAQELGHAYPIDSRVLSTGIGLLMLEACDLRDEGRSARGLWTSLSSANRNIRRAFLWMLLNIYGKADDAAV